MTDERRARQMVQYHIEGEHVFPEPECPSCRLEEALRRAGEIEQELRKERRRFCGASWTGSGGDPLAAVHARYSELIRTYAGWAAAIRALAERPESEHDGGCSAGISKAPCKCSQRDRAEAVRRFCDTMLGTDVVE